MDGAAFSPPGMIFRKQFSQASPRCLTCFFVCVCCAAFLDTVVRTQRARTLTLSSCSSAKPDETI